MSRDVDLSLFLNVHCKRGVSDIYMRLMCVLYCNYMTSLSFTVVCIAT